MARKPSLTARMADMIERQAFAAESIRVEMTSPVQPCGHANCEEHGRQRLHAALGASVEQINGEGRALVAEYRRKKGDATP